jgi:putative acetyltransferase
MEIVKDDLTDDAVAALLSEHMTGMRQHSPPESVHALDLTALRSAEITFWTAWEDGQLLGCGALKELDASHGEIKSMRTAQAHLGKGVASAILTHLLREAGWRSYRRLSLETGSGPAFDAAHELYRKFGFAYCGPFGSYCEDPFSRFMTLEL